MVVSTPATYSKETGVSSTSTPIYLVDGQGAFQIADESSVAATIEFSLDGGTEWDQDSDATAIDSDGVYAVDAGAECLARINVSSGNCTVIGKSKIRY